MSESVLDNFLSLASENLNPGNTTVTPRQQLKETDLFNQEDNNPQNTAKTDNAAKISKLSNIHSGDTDSSDDDDNKYYEDRKYNECGRDIKHLLKTTPVTHSSLNHGTAVTWKTKVADKQLNPQAVPTKTTDAYTDPIFGLRIVNPIVSFTTLRERMMGREAIMFSKLKSYLTRNISEKNWVIAGVVVNKSSVKKSQKGNQFLIWTLSDLKDDIKVVSVFLFGKAYEELWKTATGTVVGILNPSVLEKKDSKNEAALSVDNAQKVMILGQSKDLGTCKSIKKNGEQCTAVVNVSRCEYCIYHIKQEYQKCSKRSELQSNFAGRGLTALRNKVLGKNEVFYAGKMYTAVPAKSSQKLKDKDDNLLQSLNGKPIPKSTVNKTNKTHQKAAAHVETTQRQRLKDLTLLEKLGSSNIRGTFSASHSLEANFETSKKLVTDVLAKLKDTSSKSDSTDVAIDVSKSDSTVLKKDGAAVNSLVSINASHSSKQSKNMIDLTSKVTPKQVNRAKLNALKYIQTNGPLKKSDPNSVKKVAENRKRILESIDDQNHTLKKQKVAENEFISDRFKKLMAATSKHHDLLNERDNEEQEKYFHKLEVKEQMEEKMINTYKVPCKAVRCLHCKYTNFSASQFCKDNKHPLKVFDAVKRFFKCGHCGNRTQSLEVVPTTACANCGSGKWERTGMMKDKTVEVGHKLSIRGGEQKFVNSVANDANLDLLVPDE